MSRLYIFAFELVGVYCSSAIDKAIKLIFMAVCIAGKLTLSQLTVITRVLSSANNVHYRYNKLLGIQFMCTTISGYGPKSLA